MYTNKPSTDVRAPANLNWITRRGADFDPGFAMTEEQERELRISILMGQGLTRAEAEAEIDGLYRYPPLAIDQTLFSQLDILKTKKSLQKLPQETFHEQKARILTVPGLRMKHRALTCRILLPFLCRDSQGPIRH